MPFNTYISTARDGDLIQLVGLRHKHFILTLEAGAKFETHRGILQHDDLIGKPWGTQVFSHLGSPFFLLQPSLADLLTNLPRTTQIMYPKDIGFILVTMGVGPGQKVMEAGSGSGSMTTALAYAIGDTGRVVSYEVKPDTQNLARKNLNRFGLASRVDFKLRDIADRWVPDRRGGRRLSGMTVERRGLRNPTRSHPLAQPCAPSPACWIL